MNINASFNQMTDQSAVVPDELTAPVAAALLCCTLDTLAQIDPAVLPNVGKVWAKYRRADIERLAGRSITPDNYQWAQYSIQSRRATHRRYNAKRKPKNGTANGERP